MSMCLPLLMLMVDIIIIGGITRDIIIDRKRMQKWISYGGGALYIASILTALDPNLKLGLVTCLDRDDLNRLVADNIIRGNVDLSGVRFKENSTIRFTNMYVGNRRIQYATKSNYEIKNSDIPKEYLTAEIAVVTPVLNEVSPAVIPYLQLRKLYLAVELQGFIRGVNKNGKVVFRRNPLPLKNINILKGNLEEVTFYLSDKDYYKILDEGVNHLLITLSSEGAILIDKYNIIYSRVRNPIVLDETGAGDVFLAGLVYSLLNEKDLINSFEFATSLSAYSVSFKGVKIPINRSTLQKFMKSIETYIVN